MTDLLDDVAANGWRRWALQIPDQKNETAGNDGDEQKGGAAAVAACCRVVNKVGKHGIIFQMHKPSVCLL